MSITINFAGNQAVLADGKWRSADAWLAQLLNAHLATLEISAHFPPATRERMAADAAVREFGARIIDQRLQPADTSRDTDGRLRVY